MKKILLVLAVSLSAFSAGAQVYENVCLFGKGMLIDRNTVTTTVVMTEGHELSYHDASGKLIWTKPAEFLSRRSTGMAPAQVISSESSAYAFGVNSCRSKELKAFVQVFASIDQNGTIQSKDIADQELIPCEPKESLLRNAGFVGNNKCYLIYEKVNSKTETHTFYLVEFDKDLKHKVTELPNTLLTKSMLNEGSSSFPRYAFNDDKTLVYYTVAQENNKIEIRLNHFDLQKFVLEKNYIADFTIAGKEFFFSSAKNSASHNYSSGFFDNGTYTFGKQIKTQYAIVPDLATGLTPYLAGDKLYFFTQISIDGEKASLLAPVDLTAANQTIPVEMIRYSSIKNGSEIAGKDLLSFSRMEFNPADRRITYQRTVRTKFEDYDYFYYQIVNEELVPVVSAQSYFIPSPYLAAHQDYLSTDGVYNFPGITAYEMKNADNIRVLFGSDKIYVTYFPTETGILNPGSSSRMIGKQVIYVYPKIN